MERLLHSMRPEQILIPIVRQIVARPKLAGATLGRFDPWGNPYAEEVFEDPMVLAPAVRATGPVYWHPLYQQWFVSGYDEAREVLASPHVGTSSQMDMLLAVRPFNKLSELSRTMLRNLLLLTDPPQHTRLRKLVSRAFTPKQVSRLEPWMATVVDEMIADFGDEVDLVDEFADRFPARVICELIGFDPHEWQWLRRLSKVITKITDPFAGFDPGEMDSAIFELRQRIDELADQRRREPTQDLMSGLVAVNQDDDDLLSDDELFAMVAIMLIAGHETTSAMLATSVLHLHDNPDQLALLKQKPELWPDAVEELLRFDPALRTDPRAALADFELGGHTIKKGQNIIVLTQLASRDLRQMPDADQLRIDREDPSPMAFGHGIHYCVGASLARTEMRIALPPLLQTLENYDVVRSRATWGRGLSLRDPESIPVTRRQPTPH